jgi:hypothetical protein
VFDPPLLSSLLSRIRKITTPPEPNIYTDRLTVIISQEHWEKFETKELTVADFLWDNADKITSWIYYFNGAGAGDLPSRSMKVYLKEHGEQRVLDAVEHFKTLEFVKDAYPDRNSVARITPVPSPRRWSLWRTQIAVVVCINIVGYAVYAIGRLAVTNYKKRRGKNEH